MNHRPFKSTDRAYIYMKTCNCDRVTISVAITAKYGQDLSQNCMPSDFAVM